MRSGLQHLGFDAQAGRCKQSQRIQDPLWDVWRQHFVVGFHIWMCLNSVNTEHPQVSFIMCYLLTTVTIVQHVDEPHSTTG